MRLLALLLGLCIINQPAFAVGWTSHANAKVSVSKSAMPAVLYDPTLSIADFNSRLAERDPLQRLLVDITVPRSDLNLDHIVDRPVLFSCQDQVFEGRVSAVFLPGDGTGTSTVKVFAQIDNRLEAGAWILHHGSTGILSISR